MSHLHRFHVPPDTADTDILALPEGEAHHALRVARLKPGETVEVFDGAGRIWRGAFEVAGKREAAIHIVERTVAPPPSPHCTLLVAALHRPGAIEELLRRGTEVGVTRFVFFRARRSERLPKQEAKWERILVEVCKQCGRNWLPNIELIEEPLKVIAAHAGTAYIAAMTPEAQAVDSVEVTGDLLLAVGPEGDFTCEEIAAFTGAGARPITLGAYTYRSEVAAVLGATLLLQRAGAFA
ncbi:MAG: hypothetical protein RLZZ303_1766 [Candidatus Hydrogenedentota bacterium]|jgi:16S rRNA (uracil1498-N3)-methyltransferase